MNVLEELKEVSCFIFDVDGVFTDGGLLVTENDELLRCMNAKDGFALRWAIDAGYEIVIITGGTSEGVKWRFEKLGLKQVHIKVVDKLGLLNGLSSKGLIDPAKALYMGDDLPDYHIMKAVKIAVCPNDAVPEIKSISHIVTDKKGGEGCVREIIETVLRLQDKWFKAD